MKQNTKSCPGRANKPVTGACSRMAWTSQDFHYFTVRQTGAGDLPGSRLCWSGGMQDAGVQPVTHTPDEFRAHGIPQLPHATLEWRCGYVADATPGGCGMRAVQLGTRLVCCHCCLVVPRLFYLPEQYHWQLAQLHSHPFIRVQQGMSRRCVSCLFVDRPIRCWCIWHYRLGPTSPSTDGSAGCTAQLYCTKVHLVQTFLVVPAL
jgi:hypothetical protein